MTLLALTVQAQELARPEYEVKAAFLLNFSRYVQWPGSAFADPSSPFTVCILGKDDFGDVLNSTLAGRTGQGRSLQVSRIAAPREAIGCQLVFIGRGAPDRRAILERLGRLPILTVGESAGFLRDGGGVQLDIISDTVQFRVNLHATSSAGLTISSRMLHLAYEVLASENGEER